MKLGKKEQNVKQASREVFIYGRERADRFVENKGLIRALSKH